MSISFKFNITNLLILTSFSTFVELMLHFVLRAEPDTSEIAFFKAHMQSYCRLQYHTYMYVLIAAYAGDKT